MTLTATYLYGFTRPGAVVPAGLGGIDEDSPVRIGEFAGLAAVISDVVVTPFETDAPSDPEWLVPRALRHEHIIERVQDAGPVLPVRFGALFSDPQSLEFWATSHRVAIDRFLDHVAGKEEWSLRLTFDLSQSLEFLAATSDDWARRRDQLPATPGARYFQEKRLREQARVHATAAAAQAAERIRLAVRDVAEEFLLSRRKSTKSNIELVLDAAYLVKRADVKTFLEVARPVPPLCQFLKLESSGPWPASHFCPDLNDARS